MNEPAGSHDQFLEVATSELSECDRTRFSQELARLVDELGRCPAVSGAVDDHEKDPPVRWSPWMRGRIRCADHEGHVQGRLRRQAQQMRAADDPAWRAWHALAEHVRLAELLRGLEPDNDEDQQVD